MSTSMLFQTTHGLQDQGFEASRMKDTMQIRLKLHAESDSRRSYLIAEITQRLWLFGEGNKGSIKLYDAAPTQNTLN